VTLEFRKNGGGSGGSGGESGGDTNKGKGVQDWRSGKGPTK
jgi:hypothetical protein